jgi:hypothetical protein
VRDAPRHQLPLGGRRSPCSCIDCVLVHAALSAHLNHTPSSAISIPYANTLQTVPAYSTTEPPTHLLRRAQRCAGSRNCSRCGRSLQVRGSVPFACDLQVAFFIDMLLT